MALELQKTFPAKLNRGFAWRRTATVAAVMGFILAALLAGLLFWYKQNLTSKNPRADIKIHFSIESGQSSNSIAKALEKKGIIKNALSLEWYLRFERPSAVLQTGRYALSPKLTVPDIVNHLEKGKTDLFMITILPGSTLDDIKKTLQKYGYSADEIEKAFSRGYNHPLLADRPPGQDLEGYIFPETFEMQSDTSLDSLLTRDFDTLQSHLQSDGLPDKFKARGLNLHQALTMASIIQKETSNPQDQTKVAQVLYKRLGSDMKLEVDPTFIYAAKKMGVEPSVKLDSPYNTRLYKGLPPGPISNMNFTALQAVAEPASTDFLYFVAGDNGVNYFSNTIAEHEANIKQYCHKLCN